MEPKKRGGPRPNTGPKPKHVGGAGVVLAGRVDPELSARFKARAKSMGKTTSELVETAAREYLDRNPGD